MTVLKGELATKQSKALIRIFKQMKDYIVEMQRQKVCSIFFGCTGYWDRSGSLYRIVNNVNVIILQNINPNPLFCEALNHSISKERDFFNCLAIKSKKG